MLYRIKKIFKNIYYFVNNKIIFCFLYYVTLPYYLLKRKYSNKNKILILVNDNIGDTILKLGLLKKLNENFVSCEKYFYTYDTSAEVVKLISDKIIRVNSKRFRRNPFYKFKVILDLNLLQFYKIINTLYYRNTEVNEFIVKYVIADEKIGYECEGFYIDMYYKYDKKYVSDMKKLYTQLIPSVDKGRFLSEGKISYVLNHAKQIYEYITLNKINISQLKPNMADLINGKDININLPGNFITIGVGASKDDRLYPIDKFTCIVKYLLNKNVNLVFLGGGSNDEKYYNQLMENIHIKTGNIVSFINKLSLVESFYVISKSKLFLGVESGLWNAAYALNIPSVVIYGGGTWGRFMHNDINIRYCYRKCNYLRCDWNCKFLMDKENAYKCIKKIDSNQIINEIEISFCNYLS